MNARYTLVDSHELTRAAVTTTRHASGYYEVAVFPICAITGKALYGEEAYEMERVRTDREARRLHKRFLNAARQAESHRTDRAAPAHTKH
jgi:hypothetical protein